MVMVMVEDTIHKNDIMVDDTMIYISWWKIQWYTYHGGGYSDIHIMVENTVIYISCGGNSDIHIMRRMLLYAYRHKYIHLQSCVNRMWHVNCQCYVNISLNLQSHEIGRECFKLSSRGVDQRDHHHYNRSPHKFHISPKSKGLDEILLISFILFLQENELNRWTVVNDWTNGDESSNVRSLRRLIIMMY